MLLNMKNKQKKMRLHYFYSALWNCAFEERLQIPKTEMCCT